MNGTMKLWLHYRHADEQLRRDGLALEREADAIQRRMEEHRAGQDEVRRMELYYRRRMEDELRREDEQLAPLTGQDMRPEEGTAAHFERFVAGDR